jgi:hypothetical protein
MSTSSSTLEPDRLEGPPWRAFVELLVGTTENDLGTARDEQPTNRCRPQDDALSCRYPARQPRPTAGAERRNP